MRWSQMVALRAATTVTLALCSSLACAGCLAQIGDARSEESTSSIGERDGGCGPAPVATAATVESSADTLVFDHQDEYGRLADACQEEDIPDLPARAFVDDEGAVQLIASHYVTHRSVGDNVHAARRRRVAGGECEGAVLTSHRDPVADHYDDAEWLAAPYTFDGRHVTALVHAEYHGWEHETCTRTPADDSREPVEHGREPWVRCWWNAITRVDSDDGGALYTHAPVPADAGVPAHAVVRPPFAYDPDNPKDARGYLEPSNIVQHDGYYYAFFHARAEREGEPGGQAFGQCLMRTADPMAADGWRLWDGTGFTIDPAAGLHGPPCAVVSLPTLGALGSHVSYNDYFGRFLIVGTWGRPDGNGFYYALSDDLVHWDAAQPLLFTRLNFTEEHHACDPDDQQRAYPSLLQPGDPTRNFERTGRSPDLYFTAPHADLDRDLLRRRLRFSRPGDEHRLQVLDLPMNERRGETTLDASFYGTDGTLDGATWTTDRRTGPTALAFDGRSRVEVADAPSLRLAGDLTLEAFVQVRRDQLPDRAAVVIVAKDDGTPATRNWGLYLTAGAAGQPGVLHFSTSTGARIIGRVGSRVVADGVWHHVAATFEAATRTVRFWVDGRLDAEQTMPGARPGAALSAAPVRIGEGLVGRLDGIRVHDHLRTDDELRAAAVQTVLDLQLEQDGGTIARDTSRLDHHATVVGARWIEDAARGAAALRFDGESYLQVSDDSTLRLGAAVTIEGFVRIAPEDLDPRETATIIAKDERVAGRATRNWGLSVAPAGDAVPGALRFETSRDGQSEHAVGIRSVADGRWHHVAASHDGHEVRFFVDGRLDAVRPFEVPLSASAPSTGDVWIGLGLRGDLDGIRVHDGVRTADELLASSGRLRLDLGLDEGSGTVLHDRSGHFQHGSRGFGRWRHAGPVGAGSLWFAGRAGAVIAEGPALRATSGVTLEAFVWIDPARLVAKRIGTIVAREVPAPEGAPLPRNYGLYVTDRGTVHFSVGQTDDYTSIEGSRSIADAAWHHVAVTYDGQTVALYIDGALDETFERRARLADFAPLVSPVLIGSNLFGGLDEVRVWAEVLSADEIALEAAR